jgi:hypothetical protein
LEIPLVQVYKGVFHQTLEFSALHTTADEISYSHSSSPRPSPICKLNYLLSGLASLPHLYVFWYILRTSQINASVLKGNCLTAPIEGDGVVDFEWAIEVFPGGPLEAFNGTIEQVVVELEQLNPNWEQDFGVTDGDAEAIQARAYEHEFSYNCSGRFGPARSNHIWAGIEHLWGVGSAKQRSWSRQLRTSILQWRLSNLVYVPFLFACMGKIC